MAADVATDVATDVVTDVADDVADDAVGPPGVAGGRSTAAGGSQDEWLDVENADESAQSREIMKAREAKKAAAADFD